MSQDLSIGARAELPTAVKAIQAGSLAEVERSAALWIAAHPNARIVRRTAPFAFGDMPDLIDAGTWEIRIEYQEDSGGQPALFHRAALALFGEHYRPPLARALRLKRVDTIDDWRCGRSNVPKGVWRDMIALLAGRGSEVPDLLDEMRRQESTYQTNDFYDAETIQDLVRESGETEGKYQRLMLKYLTRQYQTTKGQEFAQHGFCRRLKLMVHCLESVYRALPPETTAVPLDEQVLECTVNLQSFLINVFGALDNLAWILVSEKKITRPDGRPLSAQSVGLRRAEVLGSLSVELQNELSSYGKWFDYLEGFRHPLAHRIPLYVPPYAIAPKDEAAYRSYEEQKALALRRRDVDEHDRLHAEQMRLAFFRPLATHSWVENSNGPIAFHPQLIADFNTIEALGETVLQELDT